MVIYAPGISIVSVTSLCCAIPCFFASSLLACDSEPKIPAAYSLVLAESGDALIDYVHCNFDCVPVVHGLMMTVILRIALLLKFVASQCALLISQWSNEAGKSPQIPVLHL